MIPLLEYRKNKRAWIRIVEAFIAVLIVMTTLLVVLEKQSVFVERENAKELSALQNFLSDQIRYDDGIRDVVLSDLSQPEKEAQLTTLVENFIPANYNYQVRVCNLGDEICTTNNYIPGDVFSSEVIIAANREEYDPQVVKIFMWPSDVEPVGDECNPCYDDICVDETRKQVCEDLDGDGCEELTEIIECTSGICSDGACVTCADCTLGQRGCLDDELTITECVETEISGCYRLSTGNCQNFGEYHICENGACINDPPVAGEANIVATISNIDPYYDGSKTIVTYDLTITETTGNRDVELVSAMICWPIGDPVGCEDPDYDIKRLLGTDIVPADGSITKTGINFYTDIYPNTMSETFWRSDGLATRKTNYEITVHTKWIAN